MKLRHLARPRGSAFAAGLLLAAAAVLNPAQAQQKRPNLAMLTDDTSWDDLGAYSGNGLSHATPNVDQVAKEYNVFNLHPGVARVWVLAAAQLPAGRQFLSSESDDFCQWRTPRSKRTGQPCSSTISSREPTVSRCSPTESPPASSTPFSSHPRRRSMFRFRRCLSGPPTASGASFAVLTMSPAEAKAYLPTLTNLGQR